MISYEYRLFRFVVVSFTFFTSIQNVFAAAKNSYPVILKGSSQLIGESIAGIYIMRSENGILIPAPFQVDQLNKRDEYVLSSGMPFTANSDDGYFDANDELVFMSDQLRPCTAYPAKTKATKGWLVDVQVGGKSRGCVFVGILYDHKKSTDPFAVKFDRALGEISTQVYRYVFPKEHPALLGQLLMRLDRGERALIDSSKFVCHFVLPWYLPNFSLTDENFTSEIESWQTGPVRSIVAVGVKFHKLMSMFDLHMFSELVFYESAFQIPTVFELRYNVGSYLKRGSGIAYSLKLSEPATVTATLPDLPTEGANPLWEYGVRASSIKDFAVTVDFKEQHFMTKVRLAPELKERSLPPYIIRGRDFKDEQKRKNWEWLSKLDGDFGVFVDTAGISKGSYDFGLDLFLSSKADQSLIADYEHLTSVWLAIASH